MPSAPEYVALSRLMNVINHEIVNPLLTLMFVVGLLLFIWGVVEMLLSANEIGGYKGSIETGKRHMWWGLVGMFIMVSAWAILSVIANTVCNGGLKNCAGVQNGPVY